MHAQSIEAAKWWERPRGETNANWVATYQQSLKTRHRDVIVDIVRGIKGATTVLEVGCHCGPNLVRLAQEFPKLELLSGVDVNADAIAGGQRWVKRIGLEQRIEFGVGMVPDVTDKLPSGCVDIVLSCYALAYIAPEDLDAVLYEMGRLAKLAVILAEPMSDDGKQTSAAWSGYSEWAHNYAGAAKWIGTWHGSTVRTVPVEPPVDRLNAILVATRD